MTRLIVWRHGRTQWNAVRRIQGQADIELDDVGVGQAAAAAARLAERAPDLIISSDLRRATETAAALARLTGLSVQLDPRLRERHFGPWQGLTDAEIRERYPSEFASWLTDGIGIVGVETLEEMAKRCAVAFRDAVEQVGDGTVVLVTHGGSARLGCATLLDWPEGIWATLGPLHNCHRTELRRHVAGGWWQLDGHNLP
jgi:probable phosphoglycerate mutase